MNLEILSGKQTDNRQKSCCITDRCGSSSITLQSCYVIDHFSSNAFLRYTSTCSS